jgi:hypothetical protein
MGVLYIEKSILIHYIIGQFQESRKAAVGTTHVTDIFS